MDQDREHLRLLAIFHYVLAAFAALFGSIPLIHVAIGVVMMIAPPATGEQDPVPPLLFGAMFALIGGLFVIAGWALALALFVAARCLARYRRWTFCLVVAAISCTLVPFGTILGVFTIVVLMRPSVKQLFESPAPAPAARADWR